MRTYKRTSRRKTPKPDQHHNPTTASGKPKTASPIVDLVEVKRRQSLVRLQRDFTALVKRQQRQQTRHAKALASGDHHKARTYAKLLDRTALRAHNTANEIARRGLLETPTPERQGERQTRNTKSHSRVRHLVKASDKPKT